MKQRTMRSIVLSVLVLVVVQGPAWAAHGPRSRVASPIAVPATPVLVAVLAPGINRDPRLSTAQRLQVASEVRWLHDRLNVLLPGIRSAPPLRSDGLFDVPTLFAVEFFKTWVNNIRAFLHESRLFKTTDPAVGQVTADVIAVVASYFQRHPVPPLPPPPPSPPPRGTIPQSTTTGPVDQGPA